MKQDNLFDRTLKIISRHYSELFPRLLFPGQDVRLLGTLENVELNVGIRPVDFVHQIEYDGNIHILHIEFQFRHEADFPRRFCYYHGALTEQFNRPVLPVAIYLKPRRSPIPDEYQVQLGQQTINRFTYPVIKLWDYVEQIQSGRYWQFAPLLVILVKNPDQSVLDQERQLIFREPDERRRADLLAMAVTIANRYFDRKFLWAFFRKEVELMRQSSLVEEWVSEMAEVRAEERVKEWQKQFAPRFLEEGLQQGLKQGLKQGLQQGLQLGVKQEILRTLRVRFILMPEQLNELSLQLDMVIEATSLDLLAEEALTCFSFTDFQSQLNRLSEG